ncbi:hypothetical protein LCGC14_1239410 [marine sediment metagenome]|uniref:Uncharacterized protein n=1 Tax=marine sediment metagenome TaxID=412755 RepID=A0A0F9NNI9_9ZZZZ
MTLSELRDKWERQSNAPTPTDEFQAANFHFDRGRQYCAAELQAWLREADVALDRAERSRGTVLLAWVRQKLLGTTQKAKQEGE